MVLIIVASTKCCFAMSEKIKSSLRTLTKTNCNRHTDLDDVISAFNLIKVIIGIICLKLVVKYFAIDSVYFIFFQSIKDFS